MTRPVLLVRVSSSPLPLRTRRYPHPSYSDILGSTAFAVVQSDMNGNIKVCGRVIPP